MKKIKINSNNKITCPRHNITIHYAECFDCDDAFGINHAEHWVLCKRGNNQDEYLKKNPNQMRKNVPEQKQQ